MKTCEAIIITDPCHAGSAQRGDQCGKRATHEFQGHALCWVHHSACVTGPRSCGMAKPVEFARSAAAAQA